MSVSRILTYPNLIVDIKQRNEEFYPSGKPRLAGSSISSGIFLEKSTKEEWIGKCTPIHDERITFGGWREVRFNNEKTASDATREKIASDIYGFYGGEVPETCLAALKMVNIPKVYEEIADNIEGECKTGPPVHILSKRIIGYKDYCEQKGYKPELPNKDGLLVLKNGEKVKEKGLGVILAVSLFITDLDVVGGSGKNVGYVIRTGKDGRKYAQTVKIDPGYAFAYEEIHLNGEDGKDGCVLQNCFEVHDKSIRLSTGGLTVNFDDLCKLTQEEFIITLHTIINTSQAAIEGFFRRDGAHLFVQYEKRSVQSLVKTLLKTRDQLAIIYKKELEESRDSYSKLVESVKFTSDYIETNWQQQQLYYYVELNVKESESERTKPLFDVVQEFVDSSSSKVFLLRGDIGSGKSISLLNIEQFYLEKRRNDPNNTPHVFHIRLMQYKKREISSFIKQSLYRKYQIVDIESFRDSAVLILLDGYDEIEGNCEENIYNTNELYKWNNIKVIISCRTMYLTTNYKSWFIPYDKEDGKVVVSGFVEYCIVPFVVEQIDRYLEKYSEMNPESGKLEDLKTQISLITGLSEMLSNPFILRIVSASLLVLIEKQQKNIQNKAITRYEIYRAFMNQWFSRYLKRLKVEKVDIKRKKLEDFAVKLALRMHCVGVVSVISEETKWEEFFHSDLAFSACPISKIGENVYSFVHRSFLEYFASVGIIKSCLDYEAFKSSNLQVYDVVKSPTVIDFLKDIINSEEGIDIRKSLFEWIYLTRKDKKYTTIASVAITVLHKCNIPLYGMDFSRVSIPNAILNDAILDKVNFSNSNLSGVKLHQAHLSRVDFRGCNLKDVQFGIEPELSHEVLVDHICYSVDGNILACAYNNVIKLWDMKKYKGDVFPKEHSMKVKDIAFCATFFASCSEEKLNIWDAKSFEIKKVLVYKDSNLEGLAWNFDNSLLSVVAENLVFIISMTNFEEVNRITKNDKLGFKCCAWSKNGYFAVGSSHTRSKVWIYDVKTFNLLSELSDIFPKTLLSRTSSFKFGPTCLLFDPKSKFLFIGSNVGVTMIYNVPQFRMMKMLIETSCKFISINSSGTKIAMAGEVGKIGVFNCEDNFSVEALIDSPEVLSLQFNPVNNNILSCAVFHPVGNVNTYDISQHYTYRSNPKKYHSHFISFVIFHPDGSKFISVDWGNNLCVWNAKTMENIKSVKLDNDFIIEDEKGFRKTHYNLPRGIEFNQEGNLLAIMIEKNKYVQVRETISWKVIAILEYQRSMTKDKYSNSGMGVSFTNDGKFLIATYNHYVQVWNVENWELLKTLEVSNVIGDVWSAITGIFNRFIVCFRGPGEYIFALKHTKSVDIMKMNIINEDKIEVVKENEVEEDWCVLGISFSNDGKYFAISNKDNKIKIHDTKDQYKCCKVLELFNQCNCHVFNNDSTLFCGGVYCILNVWDVKKKFLSIHDINIYAKIETVDFSPDGKMIITGNQLGICVFKILLDPYEDGKRNIFLHFTLNKFLNCERSLINNKTQVSEKNLMILESKGSCYIDSIINRIKDNNKDDKIHYELLRNDQILNKKILELCTINLETPNKIMLGKVIDILFTAGVYCYKNRLYEKALDLFLNISKCKHIWFTLKIVEPLYLIGMIYYFGFGNVSRDFKKSYSYLKKSAMNDNENNHPVSVKAKFMLAEMLFLGEGVEKNNQKALKFYNKVAMNEKREYKSSQHFYSIFYPEKRNTIDSSIFKISKKRISYISTHDYEIIINDQSLDDEYLFTLAEFFFSGDEKHEIKKDEEMGVKLLRMAAKRGNIGAKYNLAIYYSEGNKGMKKNTNLAMEMLKKLAFDENIVFTYAMNALGRLYFHGMNGIKQDLTKALELFQKSVVECNDSTEIYTLCSLYLSEECKSKFERESMYQRVFELYEKGLEEGDYDCTLKIAYMLSFGIGVVQDINQALEIYDKMMECFDDYEGILINKSYVLIAIGEYNFFQDLVEKKSIKNENNFFDVLKGYMLLYSRNIKDAEKEFLKILENCKEEEYEVLFLVYSFLQVIKICKNEINDIMHEKYDVELKRLIKKNYLMEVQVLVMKGMIYYAFHLGKNMYECINELSRINEKLINIHLLKGLYFQLKGDYSKAKFELEKGTIVEKVDVEEEKKGVVETDKSEDGIEIDDREENEVKELEDSGEVSEEESKEEVFPFLPPEINTEKDEEKRENEEVISNNIEKQNLSYETSKIFRKHVETLQNSLFELVINTEDKSLLERAKSLIETGVDLNKQNAKGNTCLIKALIIRNQDFVKLLLEKSADIFIRNNENKSPLTVGIELGNIEFVKLCLDYKLLNLNYIHKGKYSLFEFCLLSKKEDIAKMLIDREGNLPKCISNNSVVLISTYGHVNLLKIIIKKYGKMINEIDIKILLSTILKNVENGICKKGEEVTMILCEKFLKENLNFYFDEKIKCNILHVAALLGYLKLMNFLIESGQFDVNHRSNDGKTALSFACLKGNIDASQILLDNGANVDLQDKLGFTPAILAVQINSVEVLKLLWENGADLKKSTYDNRFTALLFAVTLGYFESVKFLVDKCKVDVLEKGSKGCNSLHLSVASDNLEISRYLLKTQKFHIFESFSLVNENFHDWFNYAVYIGSSKCARMLKEEYFDTKNYDVLESNSILITKAIKDNYEMTKLLCEILPPEVLLKSVDEVLGKIRSEIGSCMGFLMYRNSENLAFIRNCRYVYENICSDILEKSENLTKLIEFCNLFKNNVAKEIGNKIRDKINQLIRLVANQGDPKALYQIGCYHLKGINNFEQDNFRGFNFLSKSAIKGYGPSIDEIGKIYYEGKFVKRNFRLAIEMFKRAGQLGSYHSLAMLGVNYDNNFLFFGLSCSMSCKLALEYYLKAVKGGDLYSLLCISKLYYYGKGIPQNYDIALNYINRLFTKAKKMIQLYSLKIDCLIMKRHFNEANEVLAEAEKVLMKRRFDKTNEVLYGMLYGRIAEAEYVKVQPEFTNSVEILLRRGYLSFFMNEFENCLSMCEKILMMIKAHWGYIMKIRFQNGRRINFKSSEIGEYNNKNQKIYNLYSLIKHVENLNFERVEILLRELHLESSEINVLFNDILSQDLCILRGVGLCHLKLYQESMVWFDKLIEKGDVFCNPVHVRALYHKGIVLYESGNLEKSIECFNLALENSKDNQLIRKEIEKCNNRKFELDKIILFQRKAKIIKEVKLSNSFIGVKVEDEIYNQENKNIITTTFIGVKVEDEIFNQEQIIITCSDDQTKSVYGDSKMRKQVNEKIKKKCCSLL